MKNGIITVIIFSVLFYPLAMLPAYAGTHVLSVKLYKWDDGTPGSPYDTPATGISFPGIDKVTTSNPWIRAPEYLRVQYSSDEVVWGLRVVTDNEKNIGQVYPKPLNWGPNGKWDTGSDGKYAYVGGVWQTGDDSVSFGGLIDPKYKDDLRFRADIAWQVFPDPVPEPDSIYKHPFYGWNVGSNPDALTGLWTCDWAYVADKSNKWNGQLSDGVFFPGTWAARYEIVVSGTGDSKTVPHYLSQYPPMQVSEPDPRPGDGDIAIYLGACFATPSDTTVGVYDSVLPTGDYNTTIYLELIHELP